MTDIDWEGTVAGMRPGLVRRARGLGADPVTAEDLVQEALSEAWRQRDRVYDSSPSGLEAWLAAILANLWRRHVRSEARHPRLTLPEATVADPQCDLEVELDRRELANLLDQAMALLPSATRSILIRRFIEETPLSEMAESLGLTESAVKMRLRRGKLALTRLLSTEYRSEATELGLIHNRRGGWIHTPLWCWVCGTAHLDGRFLGSTRDLELRCPRCTPPGVLLCRQPDTIGYGVRGCPIFSGR